MSGAVGDAAARERTALGVVGSSALAEALADIARAAGQTVARSAPADAAELATLAAEARLIVMAVGPDEARSTARALGDVVDSAHLVVHTARGLEEESGKRVTEILREETCVLRVGAIAGPLTASALGAREPAACVVGSRYDDVLREAQRVLAGPHLRVYGNHDLVGVELGAALGGALSFAAGVAAGLGFGAVTHAVIVTRGLAELARIGEKLGASEHTFFGLAGVGTRLAQAAADPDEDFTFGEAFARAGGFVPDARETDGVRAARSAAALAARVGARAPLLIGLRALLDGKRSLAEVGRDLMAQAAVDE